MKEQTLAVSRSVELPLLVLPTQHNASPQRRAGGGGTYASSTSLRSIASLPPFNTVRAQYQNSPRRKQPKRFEQSREQPEDGLKTPLQKSIEELYEVRDKIRDGFVRFDRSRMIFNQELEEVNAMVLHMQLEQEAISLRFYLFFNCMANHIQRAFRGHRGRKVFRQAVAAQAALRIQRAYKAMRRRRQKRLTQLRLISRKVLRGLRNIKAHQELTHTELLNRVNHHMMIEQQWRKAMGVADTENDLINALYRKKFMRRRIGLMFRQVVLLVSTVRFWRRLIPAEYPTITLTVEDEQQVDTQSSIEVDREGDDDTGAASDGLDGDEDGEQSDDDERATPSPKPVDSDRLLMSPRGKKVTPRAPPQPKAAAALSREELRRRQRTYTMQVQEENTRREQMRQQALERQKELALAAEQERRRLEEEQRRYRLLHAQALREDLERRGLLAIRQNTLKKEAELRREELAGLRVTQAKQKIAQEVLSPDTQRILTRKQRRILRQRASRQ